MKKMIVDLRDQKGLCDNKHFQTTDSKYCELFQSINFECRNLFLYLMRKHSNIHYF